jgi:hypothetical protein
MKKLWFILGMSFLVGCADYDVNLRSFQLIPGEEFCASNGGVSHFRLDKTKGLMEASRIQVVCNNLGRLTYHTDYFKEPKGV